MRLYMAFSRDVRVQMTRMYRMLLAVLLLVHFKHFDHVTGSVLNLPVFVPVSCRHSYEANITATIHLALSEFTDGTSNSSFSSEVIDTCQTKEALSRFLQFTSNSSHLMMVGPGARALCEPTNDLSTEMESLVISWTCQSQQSRGHMIRSYTSPRRKSSCSALRLFLYHFRWKYVSLITCSDHQWSQFSKEIYVEVTENGFEVRNYVELTCGLTISALDPGTIADYLQDTKAVILLMDQSDVRTFLLAGSDVLSSGDYAVFVMATESSFNPFFYTNWFLHHNVQDPTTVLDAVFIISAHSSTHTAVVEKTKNASQNIDSRLYNAMSLAMQTWTERSQESPNTTDLLKYLKNVTFSGYYGEEQTDLSGSVRTTYFVWDYNPVLQELVPVLEVTDIDSSAITLNQSIHWPHGRKPSPDTCAFDNSDCGGFSLAVLAVIAVCSVLFIAGIIIFIILLRKYLARREMHRGPHKLILTAEDLVYINSRAQHRGTRSPRAGGNMPFDKPDLLKASQPSLSISSVHELGDFGETARLNGDVVFLKELHLKGFELKTKTLAHLKLMRELRHENINPFIGFLNDSIRPSLVMEFCSRRSLEDVINNEDIKLDWAFKLSLLTDIVRGMRYLHSTSLRAHANLKSGNCVIDSRWVLKITDYALAGVYEKSQCKRDLTAKALLWTAPELLRDEALQMRGTQKADVYSFAIITQEVIIRGHPFCMLDIDAQEIIKKIRKPPPLCRPSVSHQAAPPEYIQIMKQCWAEQPDMRPDFEGIYQQFKEFNRGKKLNIVDTMFKMLEKYSTDLEDIVRERTEQLEEEKKKTEQLLTRMLPPSVAEVLKSGQPVSPETFQEVTIYFSDIVGFTTISAMSSPMQVVDLLNDLYTMFDATIETYDVYKVETIGDAYMVSSGLPVRNANRHAGEIGTMALDLLSQCGKFKVRHMPDLSLRLRIGIHTGPCAAGVVGQTMPRYCLFGDTVNVASRMESTGSAFRIHVSQQTKEKLDELGGYFVEYRGKVELKGKGQANTYWLIGKDGFTRPLPEAPAQVGEDNHGLGAYLPSSTSGNLPIVTSRSNLENMENSQGNATSGDARENRSTKENPVSCFNGPIEAEMHTELPGQTSKTSPEIEHISHVRDKPKPDPGGGSPDGPPRKPGQCENNWVAENPNCVKAPVELHKFEIETPTSNPAELTKGIESITALDLEVKQANASV